MSLSTQGSQRPKTISFRGVKSQHIIQPIFIHTKIKISVEVAKNNVYQILNVYQKFKIIEITFVVE